MIQSPAAPALEPRPLVCGCCHAGGFLSAPRPGRIVVTHAQFDVVGMSEAQMKEAAALGAKMELCALGILVGPEAPLEWMRHSTRVPIAETAARIRSVGAQHFVLGTDLGQTGNPTPADGLQMFVAGLGAEGISRAQIETMGRDIPGALLMG